MLVDMMLVNALFNLDLSILVLDSVYRQLVNFMLSNQMVKLNAK